jgi:DNA-binding response OmpR family regulator
MTLPERAWSMRSDTQRGTILLVDDNVDIRGLATRFLERAGYSVAAAADGNEALRYYEQHRSNMALLVTDVMMPSMNGLELARRVLRIDSQLPVLFMSGDPDCAFRGLECLAKPFRSVELLERLNGLLSGNSRSERNGARGIALAEALHVLERKSLRI